MAEMVKNQKKSTSVDDGGKRLTATYVQGETTSINEAGLKKELGAAKFRKYTVEKLDRKRLEEAIDAGEVDPVVVGKHVTVTPSKPYIRYSEKENRNDEHSG